ncbi:glycosyltransferase [Desulfobacterales bacterium HSG16]|nr:glycosyltransferase [Desulfobacterales bacterium HSG16]
MIPEAAASPADETGRPLVSIICAVKDCEGYIERLVKNIDSQIFPSKELLIIDGASKDKTKDILKSLGHMIDYQVSEPDTGIYDAMDKGIEKARGKWLYFMGADDIFFSSSTLNSIFCAEPLPKQVWLLFGNVVDDRGKIFESCFNKKLWLKNTLHHQGTFYHREVFKNFRYNIPFDEKENSSGFRISGDYRLNLKLFFEKVPYHKINGIIAICGKGVSKQGRWIGYKEEIIIRHQFMGTFFATPFDILTLLRFVFKRFLQVCGQYAAPLGLK